MYKLLIGDMIIPVCQVFFLNSIYSYQVCSPYKAEDIMETIQAGETCHVLLASVPPFKQNALMSHIMLSPYFCEDISQDGKLNATILYRIQE